MIVVADTSPLNYLILIGEIHLLHSLYGQVVIPPAVVVELMHQQTPASVRAWIDQPPEWLEIICPAPLKDAALEGLDEGEREAIALAEQLVADQLIVDEVIGRREAERRGAVCQ